MKTFKDLRLALLFAVLFSATFAAANTDPGTNPLTSSTQKTIREYFKFPQVLLPVQNHHSIHTHKVEVIFTTDQYGHVNFVLAKTREKELKNEIEKQFSTMSLPHLKENVAHSVTLSFRTL